MPSRRDDRLDERIAAIDGAEDRAAEAQDAGDVLRREHARLLGIDQPVEAVFEADDLDAGVGAGLTTARMTALRPGASPPPVRTPIFLIVGIQTRREQVDGEASIARARCVAPEYICVLDFAFVPARRRHVCRTCDSPHVLTS